MIIGKRYAASLMIVAAAGLWGLIGPFSLWAAREGLSPAETAFWRVAVSAPLFAFMARLPSWPRPRDVAGMAFFGVVGVAVMYVALFTAVVRVGAGIAAVLLYTGPAWVGVFQWGATRRPPTRVSLVALLATILGVVLLSIDPADVGNIDQVGIVAGLLSGVAYATHFLIARHYIARFEAPLVYATAMIVATLVLVPVATPSLPPPGALLPILFLSVVATFAASLLFARGVVQVAPVRAAITATIEPVVATVVSIAVLGATLNPQQIFGAALVLTGVTLIMVRRVPAD